MKCFNLLAVAGSTNRVLRVGHSYGGPIALLAAIKHPDKIAGALLIGGDVSPKLEKMLWIQYAANSPNSPLLFKFDWSGTIATLMSVNGADIP